MVEHIRKVLTSRMDSWTATAIIWPGMPPVETKAKPWVRFSFTVDERHVPSTPKAVTRVVEGFIVVQVFTPLGGGDGPCLRLADLVGEFFSGFQSAGIVCFEPKAAKIVGDEGHGWYQVNVTVPYKAEGQI